MTISTKFANNVTQTTGANYAEFTNLNLLTEGGAISTITINGASSTPNRPSTLSFTGFGLDLPNGADINKISVHYLDGQISSGNINIPAPTITLLGVNGFSKQSSSPLKNQTTTHTISWGNPSISRSELNANTFGFKIDYPANTGNGSGFLSVGNVYLVIEYTPSEYSLQLKKASGGYNQQDYVLEASISNLNLTSNNPRVTITNPSGFTFKRGEGTGEWTTSGSTVTWNPKLSRSVGTSTCRLVYDTEVTFPDSTTAYTGTFSMVENLNSTTTTHNAVILHTPSSEGSETVTGQVTITDNTIANLTLLKPEMNYEIPVNLLLDGACFTFPMNENNEPLFNNTSTPVKYYLAGATTWYDGTTYSNSKYECKLASDDYISKIKFTSVGRYIIKCYDTVSNSTDYSTYEDLTPKAIILLEVEPVRTSLAFPNFTVLTLTQEELNRLGDGYEYILQCDLKHTTTDTYERDWYTNNRIGICNATFENTPTNEDIYNNADYWSNALSTVNSYESLECEFTYNSDNPLYIIITGDFTDETSTYGYDKGEISFTEPCIIEKQVYTGREQTGTYPVPILNLLSSTGNATLTVPTGSTSTRIRLYDFPNTTTGNYAIRGIEIQGDIDSTDNLVLYANIINPTGEMGQRSIILSPSDNGKTFTLGSLGDLWGFNILTLTDLGSWELELSTSNILNNSPATLVLRDITATFYIEKVESQNITVSIDGEDLSYYGAFIEDVHIPEGLETDTRYLTIDGTDTNDAYRQNIREKTIDITFNISECDLKTSTDMLRQVTKLLVNERDDYNRPIPKQVTFSHYPNDYFEYVLENTLDITTEVSGYTVKAKLVIPSGTSYSIDDTVTNTVGYAQGLAPVKPVITIQPSQPNIQLSETISDQTFNIGYSGDWNNSIVEIDCDNRKVYLIDDDNRTDISKYVDHNSDWFRLQGEYSFEGVNCIIRTVTFNERW